MSPQVSIVTPTKNRVELLRDTMDSVLAQTFEAWEHIVVDDGSDDGTLEELAARSAADPRVRFIRRQSEKGGANVCRNIGLRESRADLILFLDSDDLLRPDCLGKRVQIMDRNIDLDFAVFRAGVYEKAPGDLGRLFHDHDPCDDLLAFLSADCVWEITGPLWRRSFLERIGGFDETLRSMQDLELHVRALAARGRYVCFPAVDHDINWRADYSRTSVRHMFEPAFIDAAETARTRLFEAVRSAGLLTWSRRRALLGLGFVSGESLARGGRLGEALAVWRRACRQFGGPAALRLSGQLMLLVSRMGPSREGLSFRLVNKWRGWARFRQEPGLLALKD